MNEITFTNFQDPQPFEPSDNIINHRFWRNGSVASQPDMIVARAIGGEDCLHLSVYTRDIKPDTLKPVMVWIHGGAFLIGSHSKEIHSPDFLLRNDIVLIAINYRLGAFGKCFLLIRSSFCFSDEVHLSSLRNIVDSTKEYSQSTHIVC